MLALLANIDDVRRNIKYIMKYSSQISNGLVAFDYTSRDNSKKSLAALQSLSDEMKNSASRLEDYLNALENNIQENTVYRLAERVIELEKDLDELQSKND